MTKDFEVKWAILPILTEPLKCAGLDHEQEVAVVTCENKARGCLPEHKSKPETKFETWSYCVWPETGFAVCNLNGALVKASAPLLCASLMEGLLDHCDSRLGGGGRP